MDRVIVAVFIAYMCIVLLWKLCLRGLVERAIGVDVYELVPAFFAAAAASVLVSLVERLVKQPSGGDSE